MHIKHLLSLIAIILVSIFFIPLSASAQTLPGTIDDTNTHFVITDSEYLPITLESSAPITLHLESVPNIITLAIDAATSSVITTVITMSGFLPNTTYYKYTDSYHNLAQFITDANGAYFFTQDISAPHIIFIQSHKSTKFLRDDATGGDCTVVGMWTITTKTCTLTQNFFETIQIDSDNITLDGNNFILSGSHTGSGIYMNGRSGVTIKNLQITNFSYGVSAYNANNIHIEQNNFLNNDYQAIVLSNTFANTIMGNTVSLTVPSTSRHQGFVLYNSSDNSFQDNTVTLNARASVSGGHQGILLFGSNNNSFISNSISDTYQGVLFFSSSNNVVRENTIRESQNAGLSIFSPASGNQVYNNNFLQNGTHAVNYGGAGNTFNFPRPDGGNYWDTFDVVAEGCTDANTDGFCDVPRVFTSGQDNLPWITQDGWKSLTSQSPILSFATDTPEGLYEDDGVQDKKGEAEKTLFAFSVIYTDAQNREPESVSATVVPMFDITNPIPPIPVIMALSRDITTASTILKDGDYRNGELFTYYHPLSWPKNTYNYSFSVVVGGATTTTENQFSFKTGYSNVAFLPGLEASRLYARDPDCVLINCENQLWEPNTPLDVSKLYLDTSGGSTLDNVYARDAIDTLLHGMGGDIYKTFLTQLEGMATTSLIANYKILPYDWRMDPRDIVSRGVQYSDGTHFMVNDIQTLASTSDTGKVTIVGHSNGGLIAKVLIDALTHVGKDSLIDEMIFVASPQLGTPEAIGALLHGDEQGHFPIVSQANARGLAENMKSAYNLLPSQIYFDRVSDSVANFSKALTLNCPFGLCSSNVTDRPQLEWFLEGGAVGRNDPMYSDIETPNALSTMLLASSTSFHETYDTWQSPTGVETIQIAGWGRDTVKGLEYWTVTCKWYDPGCTEGQTLIRHAGTTTIEGDGTVVWPSAMGQNNGSRYYVDLVGEKNIKHPNITEFTPFQQLFAKILTNTTQVLPEHISITKPEPSSDDKRLRMRVLSPVSLDVYDNHGLHTGLASTSGDGVSDFVRIDEEIPGSYYREFGEGKYIGLPATGTQRVVLKGLSAGTFTFEVSEVVANRDVQTISYKDIPTLSSTVGILLIDASHVASTSLSLDLDGNGSIDMTLTPLTNPTDPVTYIHFMETSVQTMTLTKETKKLLINKLTHIERLIKKDTTIDSDEDEKEQGGESPKERILSSIDRFEQLVRQLATNVNPKKKALTFDQAIVLTDMVDTLSEMI